MKIQYKQLDNIGFMSDQCVTRPEAPDYKSDFSNFRVNST